MNKRKQLRETFNQSSKAYEKVRPNYPQELIDDIFFISNIPDHSQILEIGCATGKATEQFSSKDHSMDCIDIGQDLIDIAKEKFKHNKNINFFQSTYEEWHPTEKKYDLIFAATSFHWIDPEVAFIKSSQILKPSGTLAIFTNKHVRKNEGFFADVQSVYRDCLGPKTSNFNDKNIEHLGKELFHEPTMLSYPWSTEYTANEYIELLSTYSDHIILPDYVQESLYSGINELINKHYNGKILKNYEAVLQLWKNRK